MAIWAQEIENFEILKIQPKNESDRPHGSKISGEELT